MCRRILLSFALLSSLANGFAPNNAYPKYSKLRQHVAMTPSFHRTTGRRRVANAPMDESSMKSVRTTPFPVPLEYTFPESVVESEITLEKVLNGLFLCACFGFAVYSLLTIDQGMTRGWTQSEIAMRIPLDNWSSYEAALLEKPVMTKTVINVIIYLLGDWLSQTVFQKKHVLEFDIKRTLRNGFIGACFGPLVHQYYEFSDYILPVEGGLANRAGKILMDQTIYLTVKCSIYISAVGLLGGDDWRTAKQNVKERIGPVVFTAWKFWPLIHCITYGLIPARHRILWVNCVDLIWNAILASKAQGEKIPNDHEEPPTVPHCDEEEQPLQSAITEDSNMSDLSPPQRETDPLELALQDSTITEDAKTQQLLESELPELAIPPEDLVFDKRPNSANFTNGLAHAT